jgi:hypothetical protein
MSLTLAMLKCFRHLISVPGKPLENGVRHTTYRPTYHADIKSQQAECGQPHFCWSLKILKDDSDFDG